MKDYPITMGIDDARFKLKSNRQKTALVGVVCQGTRMISIVKNEIDIDGTDATKKLIKLIKKRSKLIQYVITHTITFGGFNLVDLEQVYQKVQKPIISVTESEVDLNSVKKALQKRFPELYEQKVQHIVRAGNLYETEVLTAGGISTIYFHCKGIDVKDVKALLEKTTIDSKLPEPVRMAHMVGRIL